MQLNPDSVCIKCGHFKSNDIKGTFACKAYPEGIPQELLDGKAKHDRVRNDQKNDVVFKEFSFSEDFTP